LAAPGLTLFRETEVATPFRAVRTMTTYLEMLAMIGWSEAEGGMSCAEVPVQIGCRVVEAMIPTL
jgi:hypothetical protein